jgi:TPR repeat protein
VTGYTEFFISLVAIDGTVLAEGRAVLVVASQTPELQDRSSFVPLPARAIPPNRTKQDTSRPAELSGEARERAELLVLQGDRYLAEGKVAGARLFFRQAADAGFIPALIKLAATYDPTELSRLRVQGIAPDPTEARKWYERARELGAPEAEERLARLVGK